MEEPRDTGDLAEVDPSLRLDVDAGEGSDASDDDLEHDAVAAAYADPGAVVEEDLT